MPALFSGIFALHFYRVLRKILRIISTCTNKNCYKPTARKVYNSLADYLYYKHYLQYWNTYVFILLPLNNYLTTVSPRVRLLCSISKTGSNTVKSMVFLTSMH